MDKVYEKVIRKAKIHTIDSVRRSQKGLIPFMNKCRMLNCDRYRYRGRTYSHKYSSEYPDDTFGIISVEDMPYSPSCIYRSDQSFISRLDTLIINNKVSPLMLFINGRFVKWENIDVVFDCGSTWLKVYGDKYNYYDIKTIGMIIIPTQVSYIATEAKYLFDRYYEHACEYINKSATVRAVNGTKRLVVRIPRINDTFVSKDNQSVQIGVWYYNQLKLYFSGLLDQDRIDKLKKISVTKTNYNPDGTIDRLYSTSVNLLDKDSIIQAQLSSVMNIDASVIENNAIFRFNDDGYLDYDGQTVIANLEDYDAFGSKDNQWRKPKDLIFKRKSYKLKPNELSSSNNELLPDNMDYSNDDIKNILFRENYIVFRNGMLCNGYDNIQIGCYDGQGINELYIPTNGYRVCNTFNTVEYNNGDDIIYNNEWTEDGHLVEPQDKLYDIDVLTFYDKSISQINNLAYKIPNMTYIEKDLDAFYKGKSEDYLTWLLKTLSFKYRNNTNVDANHDNAFNKVINHDLSLFNELYKPLNNYESCVMAGKYVNDTLITDGFFRSEAWKYTLNMPRIQVENHQTYIMIFKNGELIDNYHLTRVFPNKFCIPLNEKFNEDDTIEVFYFNNCNNNELQFTIERDENGDINRHIQFNYFNSDKTNIFTGEYQLAKDMLVYPDIVYDEHEIAFALDYELTKSSTKYELDFDKIYHTELFDGTKATENDPFNTDKFDDESHYFTKHGDFKIIGEVDPINDERYVKIKYINTDFEEVVKLDYVLNTNVDKDKYEITLKVPNEEYLIDKPLIMVTENKFIYQRFQFDKRCYKIRLDKRFRYCDNQLQYIVFINGRKLNHYDYLISIPKLSRPFNAIYLYTSKFVNPGDRVEVFYTPIKCNDFAFDTEMKITETGYINLNKDLIKYPFTSDSYWVFINGKKVCRDDIITMDSTLFKVSKDYNSLKNLSIIPLIEENPYNELNEYFHGDTKCDWDKAIDTLYSSTKYGTKELNTLFNNHITLENNETDYLSINVGRIAILNEIARDFWVKNGYDYNKDIFLYDYYINDDYNAIRYDEKTGSYILPAMDATLKGTDKDGNEEFLNIAKYDLYHLFFTYTADKELDITDGKFIEIGTVINELTFHWEYNNFYGQLDLSYQKLFNMTNSRFLESGGTAVDNGLRQYTITDTINSANEDERYFKFRIKSSDGYSVYNSYCELEFVNGIYYGLIDEDLLDERESDTLTNNPQVLVRALNKKLNNKAELLLDDYDMDNFKYFVIAVPKRYIDDKKINFYLPDLEELQDDDKFKKDGYVDSTKYTDGDDPIRCVNAPLLTNGKYIDDDSISDGDGYHGNLVSLNEYKLEKFKEFNYVNYSEGFTEPYAIFKSNGFFVKLKDNTKVRISMRVDED